MSLTSKQRARLPDSAFAYPSRRAYPVPTRAQARRAGISEPQRLKTLRNALSRAAQANTSGSYLHVARHVRRRAAGKVATVAKGKGTLQPPKRKRRSTRRVRVAPGKRLRRKL